ncbi:MAG: ATP-binding cassette domain-containing protein [Raineya sp.]|nr:ATP-binding cassette domain-containing protein [Raineya sp.]
MLKIYAENLGKKFNNEWIFRNFSFEFSQGTATAIIGNNGSGKSTLLQVISGILPASEGKIFYEWQGKKILPDNFYQYLAWASPYMELIEELTLTEMILFHKQMKGLNTPNLIEILRLEKSRNKYIKNFSSGMKQRLKLGLAIYSPVPALLLDEPTTNLDQENIAWYQAEMAKILSEKLVIVASNQAEEYHFCQARINLQ